MRWRGSRLIPTVCRLSNPQGAITPMADYDELDSISEGFADSLNTVDPNRNLCTQDGYEILVLAFGKSATCERIRKMTWEDFERLMAAATQILEANKATAGEVIDSLKAGLLQWSGDARMKNF